MTGIAIMVWYKDGKIKYQLHHYQTELQAHIERMKETVLPAQWNVYMIGHDMTFNAIKGEEELDT